MTMKAFNLHNSQAQHPRNPGNKTLNLKHPALLKTSLLDLNSPPSFSNPRAMFLQMAAPEEPTGQRSNEQVIENPGLCSVSEESYYLVKGHKTLREEPLCLCQQLVKRKLSKTEKQVEAESLQSCNLQSPERLVLFLFWNG